MIPVPGWEASARCREVGPDLFTADAATRKQVAEARTICGGCPVSLQCLAAALAEEGAKVSSHRAGIRGGTTPYERWVMHKRGRAAA